MHSLTMRFFCSNTFCGDPADSALPKVPHMTLRPLRTQLPFTSLLLNLLPPQSRTYCTNRNHWRAPVLQLLSCRPGTCCLLSLVHSPPPHCSLLTFSRSHTVVTPTPCPGEGSSPLTRPYEVLPHALTALHHQSADSFPPCGDSRPRLLPCRDSKASEFPASRGQRESAEGTLAF